jgi:histidinol-phosphate aminotransferase
MSGLGLERDDLVELEGYHSPQVDVAVRLNTNESPYPPPPAWRDAYLEELAAIPYHRYPDRDARDLRAAIAALHDVAPEQVFAANGSNEILQLLCLAYGGHGRSVAVFEPTYRLHSHIARITGTNVVTGTRTDDFALPPEEVDRVLASADPAITFLCSPNNPTGLVEPPELIEHTLAQVPGVLVVDEAYGQFAPWSALSLVGDGVPLAVVRTYSKTWSMAACRLGYVVTSSAIVGTLEKVVLPYHLDASKQAAGRLALRFREEMDARVAAIVEERGRVVAGLSALDVDLWPSGANFVLFRPRRADGDAIWQTLLEQSVLVRNCASWPRLDDCLRVTIGTPAENDAFLRAMKEAVG